MKRTFFSKVECPQFHVDIEKDYFQSKIILLSFYSVFKLLTLEISLVCTIFEVQL